MSPFFLNPAPAGDPSETFPAALSGRAGTTDSNLPAPTITGAGTITNANEAIADFAIPSLSATGAGALITSNDGIADFALPSLSATGAGAQFATPDILDNLSFESGWDGFVNFSLQDPGPPPPSNVSVERSTVRAFNGSTSVRIHYEQGGQIAAGFTRIWGDRTDSLYFRWYFYTTAWWHTHRKWFKLYREDLVGSPPAGLFMNASQQPTWNFINSTPGNVGNRFASLGVISLNTWHYWEINFDQPNARAQFWFDGNQVIATPDPAADNFLDPDIVLGPYIRSAGGVQTGVGRCSFDDNFNDVGNSPVVGDIWYDRFAVSTQRIGP